MGALPLLCPVPTQQRLLERVWLGAPPLDKLPGARAAVRAQRSLASENEACLSPRCKEYSGPLEEGFGHKNTARAGVRGPCERQLEQRRTLPA